MSSSVLGRLFLGYQLLWDARRQPAALRLFVNPCPTEAAPDARHLLTALTEMWPAQMPLLLSVQAPALWNELLAQEIPETQDAPWLEVEPAAWQAGARAAHGLPLVWCGADDVPPPASWTADPGHRLLTPAQSPPPDAPLHAGAIYAGIASRDAARSALDRQGVWALAGWPDADVLRAHRGRAARPARHEIERLLAAIDADASFDTIEHLLNDAPVLAYRFLQYLNAPELGLRHEVETVRQGLMALGLAALQNWLSQQAVAAEDEIDLIPICTALALRARLMERLLEAGEEIKLRHEIHLCGLLSLMPALLDEPAPTVLDRLPLSWRIRSTLLEGAGPYTPYLRIADALTTPDTAATGRLCQDLGMDLEDVNRALLRTLAAVTPQFRLPA